MLSYLTLPIHKENLCILSYLSMLFIKFQLRIQTISKKKKKKKQEFKQTLYIKRIIWIIIKYWVQKRKEKEVEHSNHLPTGIIMKVWEAFPQRQSRRMAAKVK